MERTADLWTGRLVLCRWLAGEEEDLARLCADRQVMRYFPKPLSPAESAAFLERIMAEFERCVLGFVGLHGFDFPSLGLRGTEIGWRLLPEAWGCGYATEAASAVLAYARSRAEISEVYSFTAVVNTPSERVMQRLGMERVGEFDHPALPVGDRLRRHVLYRIGVGECAFAGIGRAVL